MFRELLLGLPALFPQVLLDVRLAAVHVAAILGPEHRADATLMDVGWTRVAAFSALRAAATAGLAATKRYLFVAIGRFGRMFYGTSRSWTSGLVRYTGSHLIAEILFYPLWNEGVCFTFFLAAGKKDVRDEKDEKDEKDEGEKDEGEKDDGFSIVNYLPLTVACPGPQGKPVLFTMAGFPLHAMDGFARNLSYFLTFNVASMVFELEKGHTYKSEALFALAGFAAWATSVLVSHLVFCPIDNLRRRLVLQEVVKISMKQRGYTRNFFHDNLFDVARKMWQSGGISEFYPNVRTTFLSHIATYLLIAVSGKASKMLSDAVKQKQK